MAQAADARREERPEESLILQTRVRMLCSNLERVMGVLDTARTRGREIGQLRERLFGEEGIEGLSRTAYKKLTLAAVHLTDLQDEDVQKAAREIEGAKQVVKALRERIDECDRALEKLLGRPVEIGDVTRITFKDRVISQAQDSIHDLEEVLQSLAEKEGEGAENARAAAWRQLKDKHDEQSQPLFAEYVDLLRGLALRESGLEQGICELADRLLAKCDDILDFRWKSLAIPAHGASATIKARMVRLGFPEWTLWALPLAAFEFGKVGVREQKDLTQYVSEQVAEHEERLERDAPEDGWSRQVLEDSLADAIGVYTTGPAYACAALLLRHDPMPSGSKAGSPAVDGERAQVVLEVLDKAAAEAPNSPFGDIRQDLADAWSEAVRQAGARPVDERESERIARRVDFFWQWAYQKLATVRYSHVRLVTANAWADKLLRRQELQGTRDDIRATGEDIRDVLNTAWICRLANPDKAEEIHAAALTLWNEMLEKPDPKGKARKPRAATPDAGRRYRQKPRP